MIFRILLTEQMIGRQGGIGLIGRALPSAPLGNR